MEWRTLKTKVDGILLSYRDEYKKFIQTWYEDPKETYYWTWSNSLKGPAEGYVEDYVGSNQAGCNDYYEDFHAAKRI